MKNNNAPLFRSSMGGFNKKDVNEYIAKLCHDFEQREAEAEQEIAKLKEENDKLNAAAEETAKLEEKVKASDELKKSLEEAEALIAAQNEKLSKYAEEVAELNGLIEDYKNRLEETAVTAEKIKEYESMTSRMGEIFMEATAEAEKIRRDAKASSEEYARAAAEECRRRQAAVYKKLDEFAVARKSEINSLLDKARGSINVALRDFENKARGLIADDPSSGFDSFDMDTSVKPTDTADE